MCIIKGALSNSTHGTVSNVLRVWLIVSQWLNGRSNVGTLVSVQHVVIEHALIKEQFLQETPVAHGQSTRPVNFNNVLVEVADFNNHTRAIPLGGLRSPLILYHHSIPLGEWWELF